MAKPVQIAGMTASVSDLTTLAMFATGGVVTCRRQNSSGGERAPGGWE